MFICSTRKSRCFCVFCALAAIIAGGAGACLSPLPPPVPWFYISFTTALFSLFVTLSLLIFSATMKNPLTDETEIYRPYICRCLSKYAKGLTIGAVLTIAFAAVFVLMPGCLPMLFLVLTAFLFFSSFWLTVLMLFRLIWGIIACLCADRCKMRD